MAGLDGCIVLNTRWEITGRSSETLDFLRLPATHLRTSTCAANNIKKARKGEVVFLPHYPAGDSKEQHELDRNQLIAESKKRDSTVIKDLMCRNFAHRRHDVVSLQMSISDIKDRWPALFDVAQVSDWNCNRVFNTYCGLNTCMFHSYTLTGTSLVRPVSSYAIKWNSSATHQFLLTLSER